MALHKYSVGQTVSFTPHSAADAVSRGPYVILRTLPETGGVLQYRVKAQFDGQERIVREDQLTRQTTWGGGASLSTNQRSLVLTRELLRGGFSIRHRPRKR